MAIERIKLRAAVQKFFTEDPGMLKASPRTVRGYQRSVDALLRTTDSQLPAHMLKSEHFDLAMADLINGASEEDNARRLRVGFPVRPGRSPASLNNDIIAYRTFIRFLHRREYLTAARNPAAHLQTTTWTPKETIDKMVVQPSEDVFTALLEAAGKRHPRDRAVVALGAYTGFRESELLALVVGDVDFDRNEVRVWRTKQRKWHTLPMYHRLAEELKTYLDWLEATCGPPQPGWFVVASRPHSISKLTARGFNPDGGRLTPNSRLDPTRPAGSVAGDIKRAFEAAGLPELYRAGSHTLRRMAAIHIRQITGNRRAAKALLGHVSEANTERYLQYEDETEMLRQAMAGLKPPPEPAEDTPSNVIVLRPRGAVA